MRLVCLCALTLLASLHTLAASPKIDDKSGVRTRATVADSAVLARGSVFEITGAALGPMEAVAAEVPYPQKLAGVTITLKAASDGSVINAFLLSISADRIVAILPSAAPAGDYAIVANYGGEASNSLTVKIAEANFGLLTNTGASSGMAQARIRVADAEPAALTYVNGGTPGATLEFSATGLGATGEPDNEYPAEANRVEGAVFLIGGQELPVTYIGGIRQGRATTEWWSHCRPAICPSAVP